MTALDADVIVVGGGPAGAATATLLARRGRDVMVLDKARFPREKACAEYLSPGGREALARLGVLARLVERGAAEPLGMRVVTPHAIHAVTYEGRRALGVPRPLLDSVLLDAARAAGARVREGARAFHVIQDAGRVSGVRIRIGDESAALRARIVVGADGLRSVVTRSLGLDLPVRWPRRLGLVARYEGASSGDLGEMHVDDGGYCGIAPVGRGLVNVGLVVPIDARTSGTAEALFEDRVAALPGVARMLRHARRVTPVRGVGPLARRVRRTEGRGFILVGDAAGFLDPFTGEGMYRALRGAELAAAAVDRALDTDQISGYERACREEFAAKERVCLVVQLLLAYRPLLERALRRLDRRPPLAAVLGRALGDYAPAAPALRPRYLWSVLGAP